MKKILFVINKISGGGAERVALLIANELIKNNDNVKFVYYTEAEKMYELSNEIEYEYIDIKNKNKVIKKIKRITKLRKVIKQYKPDVIIAFEYFINMQTVLASIGLKEKLIISERNDPNNAGGEKRIRKLRNILYRYADILVCQTEEAKQYFPDKIQDKTLVIPNPITPHLPTRYNGERKKQIVSFCRLERQKNIPMMIDAFEKISKQYKEYKLVIYGEGTEKQNIKNYIEKKGLQKKVILNDFALDIHSKVVNSCMFVSSSNFEGISNSMIEAMGMGLPTICTDCPCGGARMMIKNNENGILVPVGDVEALYKAMKKIIDNPDLAEMLSKNALEINDKLNQNKICRMWISLT